jgi:hypothetical protein
MILWHVDPMLGNDSKISKYTTAVTKQRLRKKSLFPRQQLFTGTEEKYFELSSVDLN